ncbi:MAG: hypothetical protein CMJ18_02750 [Phycisphaeraceae bacterium]|nr:hypothetical protein [Phycisphaeraceae bacterium]
MNRQPATPSIEDGIAWYDAKDWGAEGKGWSDTPGPFDRLPARAEPLICPDVWGLSLHSAGLFVRFETSATNLEFRHTVRSDRLAMPHMAATSVSGIDVYRRDEHGRSRWVAVSKPEARDVRLRIENVDAPSSGTCCYTVYLPLYNGVESLRIGVPESCDFDPIPPRTDPPIVFYGTSIMQGACASRSGMSIPSILERRLDRPMINLGFSGRGRMEPEFAKLIAEIDAALFVIDCVPNMPAETIDANAQPLVHTLRSEHADTPILLVEDRTYTHSQFYATACETNSTRREALRRAFERLVRDGVTGLHYLEGDHLLGDDGEATVDSSHPTDLGMVRYADAYEVKLREIL